jgi:membrane protein
MKGRFKKLLEIFKQAFVDWNQDHASRLAAALAYYTVFSLAPLLLLIISIAGLIWETGTVRDEILTEIKNLTGSGGADLITSLLESTGTVKQNILSTIIGLVTLLLGALGVFNELHNSLNIIWNIPDKKSKSIFHSIKQLIINRLLSFTMVIGISFLLLVSLVLSAGIAAAQNYFVGVLPTSELVLEIINIVISLGVVTLLFAFMFKYLPDAKISWSDVWLGSFVTALLFTIGKSVIGIYLGNSAVGSAFGAAGSLVLLLLWINYSAQILFFGAEFTQAYANKYGSKIRAVVK